MTLTSKIRRLAAAGAATLAVAATSLVGASSASAEVIYPGYTLKNHETGLCLEASGEGTTAGTAVTQWRCEGSLHQLWYASTNAYGQPILINSYSGLCLDISGASQSPGARLILWHCNNGWNQVWKEQNLSYINPTTGHAVDVPGGTGVWGTQMIAYPFNGYANQRWGYYPSTGW
ncbi:RICIN domain-containing protein [Streptomyces sp. NBC_01077]|uniref:RICIN domain-containing protein n=1 Tax=Streptomyces sp. NBC_01077 TaxID=2903746 RepID=UPI00386C8F83|nr:RICIN domain-containing protein [Streptomyces sp. NBC_01077]